MKSFYKVLSMSIVTVIALTSNAFASFETSCHDNPVSVSEPIGMLAGLTAISLFFVTRKRK